MSHGAFPRPASDQRPRLAPQAAATAATVQEAAHLLVLDQMQALPTHARGGDCAVGDQGGTGRLAGHAVPAWPMQRVRSERRGSAASEVERQRHWLGADADQPDGGRSGRLMLCVTRGCLCDLSAGRAEPNVDLRLGTPVRSQVGHGRSASRTAGGALLISDPGSLAGGA